MKKELERLSEKYNINFRIERRRYDAYDPKGGYYNFIWAVVNGKSISASKNRKTDVNELLERLEAQIIKCIEE